MENVQGGRRISNTVCTIAFVGSFVDLFGALIFGPISLGCLGQDY